MKPLILFLVLTLSSSAQNLPFEKIGPLNFLDNQTLPLNTVNGRLVNYHSENSALKYFEMKLLDSAEMLELMSFDYFSGWDVIERQNFISHEKISKTAHLNEMIQFLEYARICKIKNDKNLDLWLLETSDKEINFRELYLFYRSEEESVYVVKIASFLEPRNGMYSHRICVFMGATTLHLYHLQSDDLSTGNIQFRLLEYNSDKEIWEVNNFDR